MADLDRLRALAAEPKTAVVPRRPLPGEARGIAVGGALVCDSELERVLFAPVFETLDRIHGDGRLPRIRVALTPDLVDEEGSFDPDPQPRFTGGQVLVSVTSDSPRMTLLHELGHVIDGFGFGTGRYFGSERMDRFAEWRRAVGNSSSFQRVQAAYVSGMTSRRNAGLLRYLLQFREVWARSYAQYIALHTGDARLDEEFRALLEDDAALLVPQQWHTRDFTDIAAAIDQLLRSVSWLR